MSHFCRVDSILLLENGFSVLSTDASEKMLKYALRKRWDRRKELTFDKWGMFTLIIGGLIYLFKVINLKKGD